MAEAVPVFPHILFAVVIVLFIAFGLMSPFFAASGYQTFGGRSPHGKTVWVLFGLGCESIAAGGASLCVTVLLSDIGIPSIFSIGHPLFNALLGGSLVVLLGGAVVICCWAAYCIWYRILSPTAVPRQDAQQ